MLGVLNTECSWQAKTNTNKYNESSYSAPVLLPCAIGKDARLKNGESGLVKEEEKYYILHSDVVKDGDLIDGFIVAVSEIKTVFGETAYFKAVVLNG